MTDLQRAKEALLSHSVCFVKGDTVIISDGRGIAPLLEFLEKTHPIAGFSAADKIVGKAAALLFVKCKVAAIYAKTLSEGGRHILEKYGIPYEYEELAPYIVNREGTGSCPMECAVEHTEDPDAAYCILKEKRKTLQK